MNKYYIFKRKIDKYENNFKNNKNIRRINFI